MDVPPEGEAGPRLEPTYHERFEHARTLLLQLLAHGQRLIAIRIDKATLSIRKALLAAGIMVATAVFVLAALIYSTVLVLSGGAQALGILLGNRPWLGEIVMGASAILALLLTAYVMLNSITRAARRKIHEKYDALAHARAPAAPADESPAREASDV